MRIELAPYLNQYVLCRGWVNTWEDLDDVKRVCIFQPTIKKPNKNVLYENQEKITTVHHLNLFIKWEDLENYDCDFKMHSPINFTGFINGYTRTDGTSDYGVFPVKQSVLHYRLATISQLGNYVANKEPYSPEMLYYCNELALPMLKHLSIELEEAGDYLPTFYDTYPNYKDRIYEWIEGLGEISTKIQNACKSRASRRMHKIKKDFSRNYQQTVNRRMVLRQISKHNVFDNETSSTRGIGFKQSIK